MPLEYLSIIRALKRGLLDKWVKCGIKVGLLNSFWEKYSCNFLAWRKTSIVLLCCLTNNPWEKDAETKVKKGKQLIQSF